MIGALPGQAPDPAPAPAEVRVALLLRAHFELVWRLLRRFGVEPARIDDEAQRVFTIVAAKLASISEGAERSFLVSTSLRVAANARRSQAGVRERPETEGLERFAASVPSQEELLDQKRKRELLDRILDEMSFEQRSVFVLSELEGMSRAEIAEHLRLPTGTVASRLRLAKKHFYRLVSRVSAKMRDPKLRSVR